MNILIIGAGPTGLSTALDLAQNGIVPEIVEKRTGPSALSRAVGIMPFARDHLKKSGVADAILEEGMPFRKWSVSRGSEILLDLNLSKVLKPEECMIGLPQNRTENLLAEAAEALGVAVKYGTEVTKVETSDHAATVTFSGGSMKSYDWVIAADGKDSVVRTQLEIPYPGIDLPETWSIADVDVGEGYDPEQVKLWIQGKDGLFVLVLPIEQNRLRVVSSTPDCLEAMPVKLDIRNVRRTGTFNISVRQAATYNKGRVLLAGDAAHCHSPVGGRGMNLGIDDGFSISRAILNNKADDYTEARHRIGASVLKKTENARRMVTSESIVKKSILNTMFYLVRHSKLLRRMLIKKLTTL